ncbi:WHG domain-containing protein [Paracoccus sp. ME4]|uniref:WHG domain-containing protein n=1 Tax=Paracoccus sp. ME4 TaxID=3138066 RepID=UPI00398B20DE
MRHPTSTRDPRGLHERAISTVMMLLEEQQSSIPTIERIAGLLGEPEDRMRTLYPQDRDLLIVGVEGALVVLIDTCTKAVVQVDPRDPIAQFVALGHAYLDWADRYPMPFRLLQDSTPLDTMSIPTLRRYMESLHDLMMRMLKRAQEEGRLHPAENIETLTLSARCFVSGAARMVVDGRLRQWAPGADPLTMAKALTADFVRRMARSSQPQGRHKPVAV